MAARAAAGEMVEKQVPYFLVFFWEKTLFQIILLVYNRHPDFKVDFVGKRLLYSRKYGNFGLAVLQRKDCNPSEIDQLLTKGLSPTPRKRILVRPSMKRSWSDPGEKDPSPTLPKRILVRKP